MAIYPKIRTVLKNAIPWGSAHISKSRSQGFVPHERDLAGKIGIAPNSKVLVFAGCYGDWARALSSNCEVHYTDLSHEMARFVNQHKRGEIKSIRAAPAEMLPQRVFHYDWSFSFEPYPLTNGNFGVGLRFSLLRSLLNHSGAKLVYDPGKNDVYLREIEKIFKHVVIPMSDIYGAQCNTNMTNIKGRRIIANYPKPTFLIVVNFLTNPRSRKMAENDLKVLDRIQGENTPQPSEIAKQTRLDEKTVKESLERLEKIEKIGMN